MRQLVELLKSFSDEEYKGALAQAGPAAQSPNLASRGAALSGAYTTLAGYEYRKAAEKAAGERKDEYDQAYRRVAGPDGAIETGWQVDLLKWVGNAALNYWLKGGQDFIGGGGMQPGAESAGRAEGYTESAAELPADANPETHFKKGAEYERLAKESVKSETPAERTADRRERLKRMAELLKSVSDEEYLQLRKQAPKEETRAPQLSTRAKALESVYAALAAVEYEAAGSPLKESGSGLEEAGWQVDLFKWLGNAALNYWLYGGRDFTGRGPAYSKAGELERSAAGLEVKVNDPSLGSGKRVEAGRQLGSTYEQLAAAALEPESEAEKAARKAERLKLLAELLESVTAEEYKEAVDLVPADGGARAHLASRGGLLKSAYSTLAALEYRQASLLAPKDSVEPYAASLERVSRDAGKDLVIRPNDLQETGWGTRLLGIAALGGLGYAIYENQRHHGRRRPRGTPHYTPGPGRGGGGGGGPGPDGFPYDGLWTMRWKSLSKSGGGNMHNCHSVHPVVVAKGNFSADGGHCGGSIGVAGQISSGGLLTGRTTTGSMGLPFTFAGNCVSRNTCRADGSNNAGDWKLDLLPPGASPCPDGLVFSQGQCAEPKLPTISEPDPVAGGGPRTVNPPRCVKCPSLPCGCDCLGMPRICSQDRKRHADALEAARAVEGQLGRGEWSQEAAASLHGQLAALYENLAGGPQSEAPAAVEAPEEKPVEKPAKKPRKRPAAEDPVKSGIREMEDTEKKMRREIESRQGQ